MSSVYDKYEAVIGLEVHAQLLTKSKAYCSDVNEFGAVPNTNISPISLGHPGTLPKANKETIRFAVKLGLALGSDITENMNYDRKNYFYPDLPKGYQITQDKTPICWGGKVAIKKANGDDKIINITRVHLEEDAGKSIHDQDPFDTLVDLNRAGVPLVEIVTEPELKDSTEAYNYLTEVRKLVRYLGICDGNMEEGSMRCDANISVMLKGAEKFGERCEIKNMNSIRNVQRAIDHEITRQIDIVEAGGSISMETRSFDAVSGTTSLMRSKEEAHDYRYFPEPDLQPIRVTQAYIDVIKEQMPPLPHELFRKYTVELGLSDYDSLNLTDNKAIALYFEEIITKTNNYKAAANWMMGSVKSYLNQNALEIGDFPLTAHKVAEIIQLVDAQKIITSTAEQRLFPALIADPLASAESLAEKNGWIVKNDTNELEGIVKTILEDNPD
ncbi:MAG: Asp-tRNA(Asn)/Glu-tRNA(Gln) amidotransferase subunit GatB, partial [Flavobacteriales bacterium]|nr:Asp-tRNA(Asn)/Glu-tRNA(Gln) amidotransferase subunit GatB [Flavobacteriales bacterium]